MLCGNCGTRCVDEEKIDDGRVMRRTACPLESDNNACGQTKLPWVDVTDVDENGLVVDDVRA